MVGGAPCLICFPMSSDDPVAPSSATLVCQEWQSKDAVERQGRPGSTRKPGEGSEGSEPAQAGLAAQASEKKGNPPALNRRVWQRTEFYNRDG